MISGHALLLMRSELVDVAVSICIVLALFHMDDLLAEEGTSCEGYCS